MRCSLPDTPGALGSVATALGHLPASIVSMWVVEQEGSYAVDEFCLEAQGIPIDSLRATLQAIPGVVVETVRRVDRVPDPLAALSLADQLTRRIGPPVQTLVDGLPAALASAWAMVVRFTPELELIAASDTAPVPGVLETPWLPLDGARRLRHGEWMPQNWRMMRFELAAAPLGALSRCVIVGRWAGMRYRSAELRQLELLAEMTQRAEVPFADLALAP
jgi:hypothetical protein